MTSNWLYEPLTGAGSFVVGRGQLKGQGRLRGHVGLVAGQLCLTVPFKVLLLADCSGLWASEGGDVCQRREARTAAGVR